MKVIPKNNPIIACGMVPIWILALLMVKKSLILLKLPNSFTLRMEGFFKSFVL